MHKIVTVARREYLDTVKTKTFLLGLLTTPIMIGLIVYFGGHAPKAASGGRQARRIAVTDLSGTLWKEIESVFTNYNKSHRGTPLLLKEVRVGGRDVEGAARRQKDDVRAGMLDAYVVLAEDVVEGRGKMTFYTRGTKIGDWEARSTVENLIETAVSNRRAELAGISPEQVRQIRRGVPVEEVDVGSQPGRDRIWDEPQKLFAMMVPFFFMLMMFMGIFAMGQQMLTSVIEEKSSRVIEVLLSALSPRELLGGKIAGLGAIGLTVVAIWVGSALVALRITGRTIEVSGQTLAYFAVYYVLGFVMMTSVFAGIGSVCNTLKEAQGLMMPISLIFVVPMVAWFHLVQEPNGVLARALSFFPPTTPMVMVLRLAASPDISRLEVLASMALLAAAVPLFVMAGAKVFRTGILLYGKRPGLREIVRWLGQK